MNIKHYISAAILAAVSLGLASCDSKNEPEYTPATAPDGSARVYFAAQKISKIVTDDQTEVKVNVYRPEENADEELTVQILPSFTDPADAQIFTVAPEITFPAGQSFAEIPVRFDITAMTPNKEYTIGIAIDDAHADTYGLAYCQLVLNNEQMTPWSLIQGPTEEADGYGYFVIGAPFSSKGITVDPVRVFERHIPSDVNQVEYILQAYIPALLDALYGRDYDYSDVEHDSNMDDENWIDVWHFNTADGGKVIDFPIQECVFEEGIYYAEASLLFPDEFKNSSKFNSETGVFSINVMCFDEEGAWNPAIWTINLTGYADTNDYSLTVANQGQVNIGNTDYSVINFNFSDAINLVDYTIVQLPADSEGLSEEEVEEIATAIQDPEQDKYEVESLETPGNITLTFPSSGSFEVVAVGYNQAANGEYEAKATASCIFKFTTLNPYEGWTVIAEDVPWTSGIISAVYGGNYDEDFLVNVSKSDKFDDYYRIDNPMADSDYIGDLTGTTHGKFGSIDFVIDEGLVYFPYSKIGVIEGSDEWEIGSYAYDMLAEGLELSEIPASLFGTVKNEVVSLPASTLQNEYGIVPNFVLFVGEDGPYRCNMDFSISIKNTVAGAPAKKASKPSVGKLTRKAMKLSGMKKPALPAKFIAAPMAAKKEAKGKSLSNATRRIRR
ncbi:MAG: hypothetical protein K2K82_10410 [Muribaculaceae bacterium]|nr:hypothetical protein [Muribaculaceae bacterium]